MTADTEAAIRAAVGGLAAALLAAVRAEAAPVANAPERLLGVPEAAAMLGVTRSTLYLLLGRGELRSVRLGRRRLVPASAIAAYIASR